MSATSGSRKTSTTQATAKKAAGAKAKIRAKRSRTATQSNASAEARSGANANSPAASKKSPSPRAKLVSKPRTQSRSSARSKAKAASSSAPEEIVGNRVARFESLARDYVQNACVARPTQHQGQERRLHVRATVLEDHATRIDEQAQDAEAKFAKLAGSLYSFFRGTSLLFHRDMAGEDDRMPTVLVLGDVHPENFGVMPNADNVPVFAVNDFDDVAYGPFSWDLKRGATGFMIAAAEEGDLGTKQQRKIVRHFIEGYVEGMTFYAKHETESRDEYRADNSPKIIRKLFKKARSSRKSWLGDRYLDETGKGFRANEEFTPVSSRRDEFQALINEVAKRNGINTTARAGELMVKDVAIRHGQGTASLGLPRYYVLIEGPLKDASDDLIIEFKRARRSALEGLVPDSPFHAGDKGDRIAHGQSVHLAQGDVFYGEVEFEDMSFMTRERAPFRDSVKLSKLTRKGWKQYARACGLALAQAHARSDDAGQLDYDIEPHICDAMKPVELFIDDTLCFAQEALKRTRRDHAFYQRDYELGAFTHTLKTYR